MPELHPFVLRRILALRRFAALADADLAALALVAENVTEVTLPPGSLIASPDTALTAIYFVLEGQIASPSPHGARWGEGDVFGALEVLARRPPMVRALTTTSTTALRLLARDVTEILDDSFGLMLATLRGVTARVPRTPGVAGPVAPAPPGPLGLVDRLIALRGQRLFENAPLEALLALARGTEEVVLPAGAVVARAGEPSARCHVIVEGALRATPRDGAPRMLGPGDAFGHLEALGELDRHETIEVVAAARMLETSGPGLLDIIEDHGELGRAILAVLAADLLDQAGPSPRMTRDDSR